MEKPFAGKTILIAIPNHFGLPQRFKQNLEYLGFTVWLITDDGGRIPVPLKHRAIHVYRKLFQNDRTYKKEFRIKKNELGQLAFLSSLPKKIDYTLFIRPDLFSSAVIDKAVAVAGTSAAYQWDGLERFPMVYKVIEKFDRFFVFDIRDLARFPSCLPTTNFYFDDLKEIETEISEDVFFVGTYMKNRVQQVLYLSAFFNRIGLKANIIICTDSKNKGSEFAGSKVIVSTKPLSFRENMEQMMRARAVLDFKNDIHYGLSFRTFEAVGYHKKLITNNELVEKYDFFNPKNIFVLKDDDAGLEEFLKTPYERLPENIVEKYSFSNWIRYILNIKPNTPINLQE